MSRHQSKSCLQLLLLLLPLLRPLLLLPLLLLPLLSLPFLSLKKSRLVLSWVSSLTMSWASWWKPLYQKQSHSKMQNQQSSLFRVSLSLSSLQCRRNRCLKSKTSRRSAP